VRGREEERINDQVGVFEAAVEFWICVSWGRGLIFNICILYISMCNDLY